MKTFMEKLEVGKVTIEAIDTFVEEWHKGTGEESLRESLGMTPGEYEFWGQGHKQALKQILKARKEIRALITHCEVLPANGHLEVKEFGSKGYTLSIYKDRDFDPGRKVGNDVDITTYEGTIPVDDVLEAEVSDGSLFQELERIWYGKEMGMTP